MAQGLTSLNSKQKKFSRLKNGFITYFINRETRFRWSTILGISLGFLLIISSLVAYRVLVRSGAELGQVLVPLVYIHAGLLSILIVLVARRLTILWREHRRGQAGIRLHVQLLALLSFVTILPAISVFIFSTYYLKSGVEAWFSQPVKEALDEARVVAKAYAKEHTTSIGQDAFSMVLELRPHVPHLLANPDLFVDILSQEAEARGLQEVLVLNEMQRVISRSRLTFALEFEKEDLNEAFVEARNGDIAILAGSQGDRVRALVRLDPATGTYLYIGKTLDPAVLRHLAKTEGSITSYKILENEKTHLEVLFITIFALVAAVILLAAIWLGLTIANILVRPIGALIAAAEEVSQGNLKARVDEQFRYNEIGYLTKAFNHMTAQLETQHHKLDQRRQLMESVLSGVSAGVIGINKKQKVTLYNKRAEELLVFNAHKVRGASLNVLAPEFQDLIEEVEANNATRSLIRQISLYRRGILQILQVCVVPERAPLDGFVITFDDVTPLLVAQRKAAWSDVARKIAHEIKNPLTPIQLSAERLKRRYLHEIKTQPETFQACIDTIIRQVGNIGRLVSEFSDFARMPEPDLQEEDVVILCQHVVVLQQQAYPSIKITFNPPSSPITMMADHHQFSQLLTNLLINAIHALSEQTSSIEGGKITLLLRETKEHIMLTLEDNGPGFPKEGRERLTEPYYTTRPKGTGLGLAIVAKIVEDHRGQLLLGDRPGGGARVIISFPRSLVKGEKSRSIE